MLFVKLLLFFGFVLSKAPEVEEEVEDVEEEDEEAGEGKMEELK